jgi:hypothetical protein
MRPETALKFLADGHQTLLGSGLAPVFALAELRRGWQLVVIRRL